ncbi:MAG: NAD(P)-dependent alcohol dehydrogenase [Allorhizobium sp.]
MTTRGYAATEVTGHLAPWDFERRGLRPEDVAIDILYSGVCHSDLHQARNDWKNSKYPMVPGHEIVGRVTAVGTAVKRYKAGDMVAVGTLVDSCLSCGPCGNGEEQFCIHGATPTYNGRDRITGEATHGGYSTAIVVREEFVLKMPDGLDIERAAPILCAGVTTWSPLTHWKVGPGSKVAIAGLGGLGHMGVKLAVALGAEVTVITTSPSKVADAKKLGAHNVLISKDAEAMKAAKGSFDFILDTVPVAHDLTPYIGLLGIDGSLVLVGAIDMLPPFHSGLLLGGRKRVSGSAVGGIRETQELLDFCAKHNILPETETIAMQDINTAFERMERGDVKYRFVIDMATLKDDIAA